MEIYLQICGDFCPSLLIFIGVDLQFIWGSKETDRCIMSVHLTKFLFNKDISYFCDILLCEFLWGLLIIQGLKSLLWLVLRLGVFPPSITCAFSAPRPGYASVLGTWGPRLVVVTSFGRSSGLSPQVAHAVPIVLSATVAGILFSEGGTVAGSSVHSSCWGKW